MLAVKPLSQFRWSRHWAGPRDIKPLALVSVILVLQLEGYVKEPVTLFEKSRGRRPRRQGLSDLCRQLSWWARCDQNRWTEVAEGVRLYMLTSDLTSLLPPALAREYRYWVD